MNGIAIGRGVPRVAQVWGDRSWRFLVLFIFAAWVFIVGSHHEPWFDEAQAWLLARDNGLWQLLAHRVRYEGSPGLWHAVLWLAIRAGLRFQWFFALPAGFAIAGAAVILWRAPFPAPLRVGLLASYFYGYQFSVVARSYCLDLLLVPLAATFFAARAQRPIRYALVIGLIANANAHGFLVACVLGLELAWQIVKGQRIRQTPSMIGLAIGAALGLFALFCAWQPSDNDYLQPQLLGNSLMIVLVYYCHAFIDRIAVWSSNPQSSLDEFFSVALSLVFLEPVTRLVMAGKNKVLAFGIFAILTLFSALVYARTWHAGILFLFWIFILWVEWGNPLSTTLRRNVVVAMSAILALQSIQTLRTGLWDIDHVFSPGKQTADAVLAYRATHPHARIDGYGDFSFNVQPWMDGNVFANYHHGDKRFSYILWDRQEPWMAGSWHESTHSNFWHKVLADKPDLIVASPLNRLGVGGYRADLVPEACAAGYGVRGIFPGTMIWRGMLAGDETLYLFERQTNGPCARPPSPD
jgi:hypothetical protein